jgi:glycolate oxidase
VLDLEVALPNGELIHTGAPVLKNSTGYNLTQLMIGSEGTLGIVTKARLSLVGKPKADASLLVPFSTAEDAVKAVAAILQKQLQPTALEFMEAEAVRYVQDYFGQQSFNLEGVGGHLVIQVDGRDMDSIMNECEEIMQVLEEYGAHEIFFAEDETKKQDIWKIRRNITEAIKTRTVKRGLDSVVPRANMPELINYAKQVGDEYGFQSICFGHAGDGNLHINILKNELSDDFWNNTLPEANEKIFRKIKELGGTLSAEHGVGWVQRRYMDIVFTETELELMKGIKRVFDPNGILNPGKIFPV